MIVGQVAVFRLVAVVALLDSGVRVLKDGKAKVWEADLQSRSYSQAVEKGPAQHVCTSFCPEIEEIGISLLTMG